MPTDRVYVDLQKLDVERRAILTTLGTARDLERLGVELREGMVLSFYTDDADADGNADELWSEGTVHFDEGAQHWVAVIDWPNVRHASDDDEE